MMNAQKCLQILRKIKDVSFATVDDKGQPQVRIIDIMLVENEKIYFCTARGKDFYRQLMENGQVAITGMNKEYQMVRVNGKANKLKEQKKWIARIFEENPSMNAVYPGDSRYILEAFCIDEGTGEFFDLGQTPINRETFTLGDAKEETKGFVIGGACIQCGKCESVCPQKCIDNFIINQKHCLHCGLCEEQCPVEAIKRVENLANIEEKDAEFESVETTRRIVNVEKIEKTEV